MVKLPFPINTDEYEEFSPVLSHDETLLYFTRVGSPDYVNQISEEESIDSSYKRKLQNIYTQISGQVIEDLEKSAFNQEIFYATIEEDGYGVPIHPGYPLNNAYPNSVCATFPKENALVVVNQFDLNGGISKGFSKVEIDGENNYSFPEPMKIYDFDNIGNDISFSMSRDGEHMFIAMERPDSQGETDIFLTIRVGKNKWSKPKPLSTPVNSKYKEIAPFISSDKKRLYFASDRPGGVGGLDIYVSYRLDYTYTNWTKPVLLPEPINTEAHETQPYLDHKENHIYFSSRRDGSSDIFRYHITAMEELEKELTVLLKIIDVDTGKPVRGEIQWGIAHDDDYAGFFRTYTGLYEIKILQNELFKFKADKRGYSGDEAILDPEKILQDDVTKYELELYVKKGKQAPVFRELPFFGKDQKVTLRNIYFERSESSVLPNSYPELDRLAGVLKEFPQLYIQIEGHTDNVGEKELLQRLSEQRAESIKTFLVEKGINPVRIETKGFGDSFPLNDNATENERKRNRRVEIRIVNEKT